MNSFHIPVLSEKIIEHLHLNKAKTTIFDCTIGEGGISKEILKHTHDVNIIGISAHIDSPFPGRFDLSFSSGGCQPS